MITVSLNNYLKNRRKKREENLIASWGKKKNSYRNFELISKYFHQKDQSECFHLISDKTIEDLDLELVFEEIDRTLSKIGQQYLYYKLRSPSNDLQQLKALESRIQFFTQNQEQRIAIQSVLKNLNTPEDYYFPSLLFSELVKKPNWYWVVPFLQVLTVACLLFSLIYPSLILGMLFILPANLFFHYFNKNKVKQYLNSFRRIDLLYMMGDRLSKFSIPSIDQVEFVAKLRALKKLRKRLGTFQIDRFQNNEALMPVWFVSELIKTLLLIEVSSFFKAVTEIKNNRDTLHYLYKAIGKIDMAQSIASYRHGLSYWCIPNLVQQSPTFFLKAALHPLIPDCVPNSINIEDKSMLITGSNMSGKTTFIRTVAINTLLAQTIYTTLCKKFEASFLRVLSSIRIKDNLLDEKSFYLEEVASIGYLLEASKEKGYKNLIIIDEVFKGTNTIERIGAAKGILSFLNDSNNIVLVSTHDIELTDLLQEQYELYHFQEQVQQQNLSFDYKIKKGILTERNAIKILEIAGYPEGVISEAKAVAQQLEQQKNQFP